jgi:hypothetical protein
LDPYLYREGGLNDGLQLLSGLGYRQFLRHTFIQMNLYVCLRELPQGISDSFNLRDIVQAIGFASANALLQPLKLAYHATETVVQLVSG